MGGLQSLAATFCRAQKIDFTPTHKSLHSNAKIEINQKNFPHELRLSMQLLV
jgi:hypothetical protein